MNKIKFVNPQTGEYREEKVSQNKNNVLNNYRARTMRTVTLAMVRNGFVRCSSRKH